MRTVLANLLWVLRKAVLVMWCVCLPILMPVILLIILMLGLYSGVALVFSEVLVWLSMWRKGRLLPRKQRDRQLVKSSGTIIIEHPTVGWNVTRAWWTSDDVQAESPVPPPDDSAVNDGTIWDHPYLTWAHGRYTDLQNGRACLLAVWNGKKHQQLLSKQYPHLKSVEIWSGAVGFAPMQAKPS